MKKAIIVVSFGTSHLDTLTKNISVLYEEVKKKHTEFEVRQAFTSRIIIRTLAEKGVTIPFVEQALERLVEDKITEVYIQPTHVIPGEEFEKLCKVAERFRNHLDLLKIGQPLLSSTEDMQRVASILSENFRLKPHEAVVFMGHGTSHYVNTVYPAMDYILKAQEGEHFFVGTVEGYPDLQTVISLLHEKEIHRVIITPLMLVAGDHAVNDMAGDQPGSWKNILKQEGFAVEPVVKGLGEYPAIRQIYLEHLAKLF